MFKIKLNFAYVIILVSICLFSCAFNILEISDPPADPSQQPVDLSGPLQLAHPEAQGFDSDRLARALGRAAQIEGLRNLVVLRNGVLVVDESYAETAADTLIDVRGSTVIVTTILIGMAIEQGLIPNEQLTLNQLLTSDLIALPEEKMQLTLRTLLTMSTGWQWSEQGGDFLDWVQAPDQISHLADLPQAALPGTSFNYNSTAAHLLSVVLTETSGMSALDFAQRHLFEPLNISVKRWQSDSRSYKYGSHGLFVSAMDMVKIGQLFLQGGFSGTKQIVSGAWLRQASETQFFINFEYGSLRDLNFGYLLWRNNANFNSAFFTWGYAGQFIFCVPDRNLVIVTTADCSVSAAQADQQESMILEFIATDLLRSARPISRIDD